MGSRDAEKMRSIFRPTSRSTGVRRGLLSRSATSCNGLMHASATRVLREWWTFDVSDKSFWVTADDSVDGRNKDAQIERKALATDILDTEPVLFGSDLL